MKFPKNYTHDNCPFAQGYGGGCQYSHYCKTHNICKFDVVAPKVVGFDIDEVENEEDNYTYIGGKK